MSELKIYSVSDEYIAYLRKEMPNVYSNKIENRAHTRKYVGVVIEISGYKYYIPMSSPKDTDYQIAGENRAIKKSIVPIIRMVVKNTAGEKELKGTLRISHMIPVPESELELYDLDNANLINKQKKECDTTAGYVKSALDYMALEKLCDTYMMELQGEDNTINHSDL